MTDSIKEEIKSQGVPGKSSITGESAQKPWEDLTRRKFIRGALVAGGGLYMAGALPNMSFAAPKRGGTLRMGIGHGSTTDSYDPATWDQVFVQVFAASRMNYLTEVAPDGKLIGDLAESWDSKDAKNWSFKIRQGVVFHSGKSLTVDDVIASINYHRGDDSKSPIKALVEQITSIKANGKSGMSITLKESNADFPFVLSDYHLPIMASKGGKIDPTSSDGTGGYKVKSFEPGVSAVMVRNPNYWKKNAAFFDGVELLSIPDSSARLNALTTGEVDVIDRVDLSTVHLLKRNSKLEILSTTGNQHYTFPMDTRQAPYSDNHVRLALKYAIDREELVEKVLNGYGMVGNDHPIGPSQRYYAKNLEQKKYDPDKAKFHLKKAGLDKLEVSLSAADAAFTGAVDAGVLYSEKAKAAGITVKVVREPNDGYWDNVWMKKPFVACYWGGRPTEDWMFSTAYSSEAKWNDTYWKHDKFNQLLKAARSEVNDGKRRSMYADMQEIVSNDGGVIVPMFASYVMAMNKKVKHPDKVGENWVLDGFRAAERWWFG